MFIHQFIEYLHDNVWMQVYKSDRKNRNNTGSIRKVGVCVCVWVGNICCSEQNKASHRKVYDNLFCTVKQRFRGCVWSSGGFVKRTGEDGFTHPRCYKLSGQPFLSTCVVVEYLTKMDRWSIRLSVKCDVEVSDVKTGHADKQTFSRVRSRRPQLSDTNLHHMIPDQEKLPCQQLKKK